MTIIPMIKLELEYMKQTMLTALANYNEEMSRAVEQGLEDAINSFDFPKAINDVAAEVIEQSIQSYFRYGNGRRVIEAAVQEALNKIFIAEQITGGK